MNNGLRIFPMKLKVQVKPNSKISKVVAKGDMFVVYVKSPPVEGKANDEMLELLSEHLGVPKSRMKIVSGKRSRNKIVSIRTT